MKKGEGGKKKSDSRPPSPAGRDSTRPRGLEKKLKEKKKGGEERGRAEPGAGPFLAQASEGIPLAAYNTLMQ